MRMWRRLAIGYQLANENGLKWIRTIWSRKCDLSKLSLEENYISFSVQFVGTEERQCDVVILLQHLREMLE